MDRVEIKNYRSIGDATIAFTPSCRILVGKNEVGKTNLLSACSLLDLNSKVAQSDLRESTDDELPVTYGYVRFVFQLSNDELLHLKKQIVDLILGQEKILFNRLGRKIVAREIVPEFKEHLHIVNLPNGERRSTYWNKTTYQLADGWLMPKPGVEQSTIVESVSNGPISIGNLILAHETELDPSSRDQFVPAISSEIVKRIGKVVSEFAVLKYPECVYWSYSDTSLLPSSIDIESFKNSPASCEPLRSMFLLAHIDDPGKAITEAQQRPNALKNLLTRVARATGEHVRHCWSETSDVEIVLSPNGAVIDAAVKDSFNEYSFARRSDGFKRFVSFLIMISARAASNDLSGFLFIQDEPDLALHPTGIRSLLAELIKISKENNVLLSTHSIFMIDKERIDRHIVVTKSKEVTELHEVDRSVIQDEEVLFNALGYSLLEHVRKNNFLFEGWRDKKLFLVGVQKKTHSAKILREKLKKSYGLTHAMGVKDLPKVVSIFDLIDRVPFIVSDGDQVAREKQAVFRKERPNVHWYRYDELIGEESELTAEDFITPARLMSSLRSTLDDDGIGPEVSRGFFSSSSALNAVARVEQMLANLGIEKDRRKAVIHRWKSEIFDSLEVSEVNDRYLIVMDGLVKILA